MKLSSRTLEILGNFGGIHPNLLVVSKGVISTHPPSRCILAIAKVSDTFPTIPLTIYNLGRIVSLASIFKEPDITFGRDGVKITDGQREMTYNYSKETMNSQVLIPRLDGFVDDPDDVSFRLTADMLKDWNPDEDDDDDDEEPGWYDERMDIMGDGTSIRAVRPSKNSSLVIGGTDKTFSFTFRCANFRFLPQDYDAVVNLERKLLHLKSPDLEYWIPAEAF